MKNPDVIVLRPNADDRKLFEKLYEKLGLGKSQIIRLAIRSLAKNHKITLKSA